jgi:hypothetical protein
MTCRIVQSSLDVEDPIVTVRVNRGGEFGSARVDSRGSISLGSKRKYIIFIYMADIEPGLEEEEKAKKS